MKFFRKLLYFNYFSMHILMICHASQPSHDVINKMKTKKIDTIPSSMIMPTTALNGKTSGTLDENDPVLAHKDFNSYYKIYEAETNTAQDYEMELVSSCSCFGFDKHIFIPIVLAINEEGNIIKFTRIEYKQFSYSILLRIIMNSGNSKKIRIIVFSDNSVLDAPLTEIHVSIYPGVSMPGTGLMIRSYPLGSFRLKIKQM